LPAKSAYPHNRLPVAVALVDQGATVPFVALYRMEVTGGLDDTQLPARSQRPGNVRKLEGRRSSPIGWIDDQGKPIPEQRAEVANTQTKQRLNDLQLHDEPKCRTKAQIACDAGLGPLARALCSLMPWYGP